MSKCDRCGAPSVYHSKLIVNGVSQSTNLCRDCAIKEGVFNNQPTSMFDDILSSFSSFLGFEEAEDIVCPVCKTSLKEFKTTGKLGCSNCYETFREEVVNLIKRIAPFEKHKQQEVKVTLWKLMLSSKGTAMPNLVLLRSQVMVFLQTGKRIKAILNLRVSAAPLAEVTQ